MSLDWQGDKVISKMDKAVMQGMNQTMAQAVVHAKQNHPWQNRTGTLEGSIRPVVAARPVGDEFIGLWGSADVNYALPLELGSVNMEALPYLRPAADAIYPKLTENIKRFYKQ